LPSSLSDIPWEMMFPCQIACGSFGSVTSIAVIAWTAVPAA
jgi:hypothetical protein